MPIPVILPRQGQSVESCIITKIVKNVGDKVEKGELLFSYETDKASFDEEAPETGTILAIFCNEGDEVPVLENICVIGNKGESFDEFLPSAEKSTPDTQPEKKKEEMKVQNEYPAKTTNISGETFISPRAKKLALKEGVDFSVTIGSGPKGRIIEQDILTIIEQSPKKTPLARKMTQEEGLVGKEQGTGIGGKVTSNDLTSSNAVYTNDSEIIPLSNIRKIIAESMHRSLQNSAQLTHHLGADARNILSLRKKAKAAFENGSGYNLTLNDLVCFAVTKALKKFPEANAHFLGDSVRQFHKVHLGLAVDTDRGLMVPAIKNADDLSIQGLSAQIKSLAEASRKGNVNPELLAPNEASFTVSNLGNYGVEMFTPVINLPQVAILGVNTILPRPADMGDGIYGFVPYMGLSLTYDHRAIDGGLATRFLKSIATEIENLEIEI